MKQTRYLIFSDVHGEYDVLQAALRKRHYDPTAKNQRLVDLGDNFDRGLQSRERLEWITDRRLANKLISIRGNHEVRWNQLMDNPNKLDREIDVNNGALETLNSWTNNKYNLTDKSSEAAIKDALRSIPFEIKQLFSYYWRNSHWYADNKTYLCTHAWLPFTWEDDKPTPTSDWYLWAEATWTNTLAELSKKAALTKKTLVIGHYWNNRLGVEWALQHKVPLSDVKESRTHVVNCSPDFIALDNATYSTKQVAIWELITNDHLRRH